MSDSNSLFIIVKDGIKSFDTIESAIAEFSDLATYVIEKGRIVELTLNKAKSEWNIKDITLVEVAKGFRSAQ